MYLILSVVVGVIVVVAELVRVVDYYGNEANETNSCAAGLLSNCVDKLLIILTSRLFEYFLCLLTPFHHLKRLFLVELGYSN